MAGERVVRACAFTAGYVGNVPPATNTRCCTTPRGYQGGPALVAVRDVQAKAGGGVRIGTQVKAMNAYAQRRAMLERDLRSPDVPTLSNNEISRLLGVGVVTVWRVRRDLEARGAIPKVLLRMARHGNFVNVARLTEPPSMKAS